MINLGKLLSGKELAAKRMAVCEVCPHYTKLKRCSQCGCFMPAKTQIAGAKCPIGKWGKATREPGTGA